LHIASLSGTALAQVHSSTQIGSWGSEFYQNGPTEKLLFRGLGRGLVVRVWLSLSGCAMMYVVCLSFSGTGSQNPCPFIPPLPCSCFAFPGNVFSISELSSSAPQATSSPCRLVFSCTSVLVCDCDWDLVCEFFCGCNCE